MIFSHHGGKDVAQVTEKTGLRMPE